jgi:hypothetical protein
VTRIKLAALLSVAVCVGAAGAQVFARQKADDPPPAVKAEPIKTPTVKWRYKLVRLVIESDLAIKANEEAEKGWEVVQAVLANDKSFHYSILLRRPADVKD